MQHVLSLTLAAVLVAVTGLAAFTAPDPPPPEIVTLESASHSVTIEYLEQRGDYRRARVSVRPVRGGERPAWRGDARSFRLLGNGSLSTRERDRFVEAGLTTTHILSSGFGNNAAMVAPSPRTLVGVEITTARGQIVRFVIPGTSARGRDGDTDEPPPEDPKPDPDPEPEPDPDPPDDDYEEFCNPFKKLPCNTPPGDEQPAGPPTGNGNAVSFTF